MLGKTVEQEILIIL